MTHFFCLNGPLHPKMQNLRENTENDHLPVGLLAQLCIGIAEVMDLTPIQALFF